MRLDRRPSDLRSIVEEVVERWREPALQAGVVLALAAPGALPGLWDRVRIEQVVHNLLSNAVKYGEGRPVEISLETSGSPQGGAREVRLTITDAGSGIPSAERAHIFERYHRGDSRSRQQSQGLGLGLYIVREIVQAHGGRVRCSSREGAGSTFVVELPIHTDVPLAQDCRHGERPSPAS